LAWWKFRLFLSKSRWEGKGVARGEAFGFLKISGGMPKRTILVTLPTAFALVMM